MQEIARLHQRPQRLTEAVVQGKPGWFAWRRYHFEIGLVPVALALFVLVWEGVIRLGNYPTFILPSPGKVATTFARAGMDGTLWHHAQATLSEVFTGLALGLVVATVLGYFLARNSVVERLLAPYIVALQSVPVVAIAPLLVIWFGSGRLSKVLVCALIVFFPVLVNTIVGIRSVDEGLRDLMRSLRASRWQTFYMLDMPAALPVLFGGLKIGVTLSVIGAVVGEFVGADRGLGFLINQARGLFNTPLVFVAIFSLAAIALILYGLVTLLEAWLLRWRRS
ncbi:MAG: ABC transporter permease [Anaerolineae bacterium]|nr:ABC transporter permease [Anaerolineae bacterium]